MCQGMGLEPVVEAHADDMVRAAVDILARIAGAHVSALIGSKLLFSFRNNSAV